MTVIVIDVNDDVHADLVVDGWVDAGLSRPAIWGRLRGDDETGFNWRVLGRANSHLHGSVVEIFNQSDGDRETLHTVVLSSTTPSADSPAKAQHVLDQLTQLKLSLGDRSDGPSRIDTSLLLLPHRSEREWAVDPDSELLALWPWTEVLLLSPEDAPAPDKGNELGDELSAALVAHMVTVAGRLASLSHHGLAGHRETDGDGTLRLVRGWSRVVDGGFVTDHLGAAIRTAGKPPRSPADRRVAEVAHQLAGKGPIADELEGATRPESVEFDAGGLWGFFSFALAHVIPAFFTEAGRWLAEAVASRLERIRRWVQRLRKHTPELDTDPPTEEVIETPIETELRAARAEIDLVRAGGLAERRPSHAAEAWQHLTRTVVTQVRDGELTLAEAVGNEDAPSVAGSLAGLFIERRDATEAEFNTREDQLRQLLPDLTEPEAEEASRSGLLRRLGRRVVRLVLLVLGVVLLFVPGAQILGILLIAGAIVGPAIQTILRRTTARLRRMYFSRHLDEIEDTALELIKVLRRDYVTFSYRADQVSEIGDVLCEALDGGLSSPPISDVDQGEFAPRAAPRAVRIATAEAATEEIEAAADELVSDPQVDLFGGVWAAVVGAAGRLYELESRSFRTSDIDVDIEAGLAAGRQRTRDELIAFVEANPLRCIGNVVEWERGRMSEHGLEVLEPPPGIGLGPANRTSPPSVDLARLRQAFEGAVLIERTEDGPMVITAVAAGTPHYVIPVDALAEYPDKLAVARQSPELAVLESVSKVATSPLPLGSFASLREGASVVVASWTTGDPTPIVSTVTTILSDGRFRLDHVATPGSPVLSDDGTTILGIVDTSGRQAISVLEVRRVVTAPPSVVSAGELDPGVVIPIDVAGAGGDVEVDAQMAPDVDVAGAVEAEMWLREAWEHAPGAFPPYLVSGDCLKVVDRPSDRPFVASHHPSGRLLLSATLLHRSDHITLDDLREMRRHRDPDSTERSRSDDLDEWDLEPGPWSGRGAVDG